MHAFPHRCFALILTLVLLATGCATQGGQERVALIIGNSAYSHATSLKNPSNDAAAMADAFRRLGFSVVQGQNLTHEGMERQVYDFLQRLDHTEVAVFFYAGHGLQLAGKNFLVPVDFDPERDEYLTAQLIQLDWVLDKMPKGAKHNLIFLDACRDNPFTTALASKLANGRSVPIDATRGMQVVGKGGLAEAYKVVGKGLAEAKGSLGTLIAYATPPGNVASDGSGANSPFTTGLLRHLEEPGLEIRQVLTKVRMGVVSETGGQQIPWDNSSLTDNFYLKKKPFTIVPPVF